MARYSEVFANKRLLAVLFLGFSSGLPLTLTGSSLQAWFTESNVSVTTIGFLSLVGLPYTLKFLWAPFLDSIGFGGFGKRRGWVLLMQFVLALSLFTLAFLHPDTQTLTMACMALLVAFFSATQDVGVDAYRADVLLENERGLGAAYFVFSYRVALLFGGGLALIFADYLGWKLTYIMMGVMMLAMMLVTYFSPPANEVKQDMRVFPLMKAAMSQFLSRDKIIFTILFIIFYKVGDALALSLMTNFLLHGLSFTLTEVGLVYKIVSFAAVVSGGLVGGVLLTRWPILKALLLFGLLQAFSNLMFVLLALVGKNITMMALSIFIENFCSGLSTAALIAFMMSLCDKRYTASQYALLSAIASLGRVFLGPLAGFLVVHFGWIMFFTWSFVLSFPGLVMLLFLKNEVPVYVAAVVD